jgi:ATP-dependent Lon protease
VLPIGGVKQKLLAAQRAGLTTVFVPKRNEPDLDDVPADVLETINVILTTDVAELVAQAIEPAAADTSSRAAA